MPTDNKTPIVDRTWRGTALIPSIGYSGYGPGDRLAMALRDFAGANPLGLRASVLRGAFKDCSNNGVSARCSLLLVLPPDTAIESLEERFQRRCAEGNLGILRVTYHHGGLVLKPVRAEDGADRHLMMGGNFAYTPDSRWPCRYPLPIHDRVE